ncbi:MAG: NAD-dependent epimerase/dehydratase family protein [Candidatus Micrarchaeota archaeon]
MILITGATGRIGGALAKRLISSKKYKGKVRILVRDVLKAKTQFGSTVEIFEGDLASAHDFIAIAQACKGVDAIIHCAASVDYSLPEREMMQQNYFGTARLIKSAKLQKKSPKFIFISSTSIYRGVDGEISEATPPKPFNAYGKSKLEAENALKNSGLNYIILRPSVVYGEGFKTGFAPVIKMIAKGRMPIIGFGKNHIPHIYLSDLVDAIILALESKLKHEDFIISSGEKITQLEAYGIIAKELGVSPPNLHFPKSISYFAAGLGHSLYLLLGKKPKIFREYVHTVAENKVINIGKATKLLHFRPKVGFKAGIKKLIAGIRGA